jgi:tRNA(Ile)-lysidine synthase
VAKIDPSVAAVRVAVARTLGRSVPRRGDAIPPVLVACSGGPDSLALAAATAFLAPRMGFRAGLATVDHQLQEGSAEQAHAVAAWAREQGYDPVSVLVADVAGRGGGPEAAARQARYEALAGCARSSGMADILVGHTQDDQAETVLLAMLRGAGLRGLAGMPIRRELDGVGLVRPLLTVSRAQTRSACTALGLLPWQDPHNTQPRFARARARTWLESLVDSLGGAVVANLARTAELAAADGELLDELAGHAAAAVTTDQGELRVAGLAGLPTALRTRVLRDWARKLGVSGSALSHRHVRALDALVVDWHGQGRVYLPGAVPVTRCGDVITVR